MAKQPYRGRRESTETEAKTDVAKAVNRLMNETTVDVVEKMEEADDAVGQLENTKEMIQVFFLIITIIFYK